MAFSSIGSALTSIPKVINPSLLTPKLPTGLIPSGGSSLSALAAAAANVGTLTPAQIAAAQALLGKK
ncbi:hypothetical protein [Rhizobium sp. CCGE 510]|uniref:hypothetical protein n=1 Tax=Rhizobium sp. CCGE 510 TaxID=1132836 RepID=UPI00027B7E7E|nr:hypothetical protein [Rhizobium sp. CCGE 510]EJT04958.1 hypothetical protein RCCGE510_12521 [Rhizobium sp. CCGE 510]